MGLGGVDLATSSGVLIRERVSSKQAGLSCTLAASPPPPNSQVLADPGRLLPISPPQPSDTSGSYPDMISNRQDPEEGTACLRAQHQPSYPCIACPSPCHHGTEEPPRVLEQVKAPHPHPKEHTWLQNTPWLSPSPSPAGATSHLGGKGVIYIRRDPQTLALLSGQPSPSASLSVLTFNE